ncbi:UNVERIFIED_CONTAM: ATP-binding protein, partial [Prevotella sp. 15_C9]
MLSREIATTVGGRFWNKDVYPYSFAEYLNARDIILSKNWMYVKQAAEVSKAFNDYFLYGGFPVFTDVIAIRVWL